MTRSLSSSRFFIPILLFATLSIQNLVTSNSGPQPTNSNNANIYLIDSSRPPSSDPVSIRTDELNALLSHRLEISDFETLPESIYPSTKKGQIVFGDDYSNDLPVNQPSITVDDPLRPKFVIVVYGSNGSNLFPQNVLEDSIKLTLKNPPDSASFDALMSTYIGRMVNKFNALQKSSSSDLMFGIGEFLKAYNDGVGGGEILENLENWVKDWEGDLDQWLDWGRKELVKIASGYGDGKIDSQMIPREEYSKWLNSYGTLDSSAIHFIEDLKTLDRFTETLSKPTSLQPKITFLRLSGLQKIQRQHGDHSRQYRTAFETLKVFLEATFSNLSKFEDLNKILIAVPTQPVHTRLAKRMSLSLLSPFQTSESSFVRRDLIERRRSIFGNKNENVKRSLPIVSSDKKCFKDQAQCESSTKDCNGHGKCVEGRKSSGDQDDRCFVCSCVRSKDESGKLVDWSGETCQKIDISNGFILLSGTGIGLVVLIGFSIYLLGSVGSENLPQQLSSVSGSNKKLD